MQPTSALQKAFRKFRLTTKDIKKGFYKGTGSGSMGRHTKHGGYVIEFQKVRTYVVPSGLDSFKVCTPRSFMSSFAHYSTMNGPRNKEDQLGMYEMRYRGTNGRKDTDLSTRKSPNNSYQSAAKQTANHTTHPQLTPFVTKSVEKVKGRYEGNAKGPDDPELYLNRWKDVNGLD
ncbi:hypothetical protein F5Y18DRAFT_298490 [Xylariaceae sp. FL1019]|nr:hypothetical protein F5Y18DRAFT_298490 [Xylariaceae sp. FL1019]